MSLNALLDYAAAEGFTCLVRVTPVLAGYRVDVQLRKEGWKKPIFSKTFPADHPRLQAIDCQAGVALGHWSDPRGRRL